MDRDKLQRHIQLCVKQLKDRRFTKCTSCPFEEEVLTYYPQYAILFQAKREFMKSLVKHKMKEVK